MVTVFNTEPASDYQHVSVTTVNKTQAKQVQFQLMKAFAVFHVIRSILKISISHPRFLPNSGIIAFPSKGSLENTF
jgi:hypothetical protein